MRRDIRDHRQEQSERARRELKQSRFGFFLEDSLLDKLRDRSAESGDEMSEIARRAIANEIAGVQPNAMSGTGTFRAPVLSRVPCGPWQEAVMRGGDFTISEDVADELEAREGDVWVRADGQSMEGAGIGDGFMVLMRPLAEGREPRRGEIALVQVFLDDGSGEAGDCVLGTVKHWQSPTNDATLPALYDGEGQPFELPPGTVRVVPVAVARGVLGRL